MSTVSAHDRRVVCHRCRNALQYTAQIPDTVDKSNYTTPRVRELRFLASCGVRTRALTRSAVHTVPGGYFPCMWRVVVQIRKMVVAARAHSDCSWRHTVHCHTAYHHILFTRGFCRITFVKSWATVDTGTRVRTKTGRCCNIGYILVGVAILVIF